MTIAAGRTRGRAGADFSPPFFLSLFSPRSSYLAAAVITTTVLITVFTPSWNLLSIKALRPPVWRVIVRFYRRTSVGSHYSIALLSVKKKEKKTGTNRFNRSGPFLKRLTFAIWTAKLQRRSSLSLIRSRGAKSNQV